MGFKGLAGWLGNGQVSAEFYHEILKFVAVYINSKRVDSRKYGMSKHELAYEVTHSFVLKLPQLRMEVLERSKNPEAYFTAALRNFVLDYLSKNEMEYLSLDSDAGENRDWIEVTISAETYQHSYNVLNEVELEDAEDEEVELVLEQLVEELEASSQNVRRNLMVFFLTELRQDVNTSQLYEYGLTPANIYKIRQRAKEFLKSFAREHGYDERAVVKATFKYLSAFVQSNE
ncbi:hypothetical protein [Fervidobacterium thailandense]|uniref:Uncharacterized protein n=1 Tax=Fervidobacterium thailandense TaxID=1008305 RepID=A0A1E3G0T9_9BACT|nr:hypothetical protein [Fervidobacterium thailandense]ODN29845.1 hypothetical protein A4H02_08530 [Fervidobacterium thailandense]